MHTVIQYVRTQYVYNVLTQGKKFNNMVSPTVVQYVHEQSDHVHNVYLLYIYIQIQFTQIIFFMPRLCSAESTN